MTTTLKIKYVDELVRADWTTIEQVKAQFTEEDIVEMVNRYQDTQKHAIAYRKRSAEKNKLMAARLAELESKLKQAEEDGGEQGNSFETE